MGRQSILTPMMRQYKELKAKYADALLFFRMGDFYEMFYDDAVTASRELEITLTSRGQHSGADPPPPMCGVPYHAVEGYIARLASKGYKVAVCEQLEEPGKAKKLLRRDVVRVHTPGTFSSPATTQASESIFLASLLLKEDRAGLAFLDLSTGDFLATDLTGRESHAFAVDELARFGPKELLVPEGQSLPEALNEFYVTEVEPGAFSPHRAERRLREHFQAASLDGFGLSERHDAISAAGACLYYVEQTQKASLVHISGIRVYEGEEFLVLDEHTRRNLEILKNTMDSTSRNTLVSVVDHTVTAMGGRLLRQWLIKPSRQLEIIRSRLDGVDELFSNGELRARIREELVSVSDLERLLGRVVLETANPRDLSAIRMTLVALPGLKQHLKPAGAQILSGMLSDLDEMPELTDLLQKAILDNPSNIVGEGTVIRPGFDAEFDETNAYLKDGKKMVAALERKEREATGISNLKLRYNKVFGYYLEVSRSNLKLVPDHYERRQTLVNAERFITPELKDLEARILGAEEKVHKIERDLFDRVLREVGC
ncbi:DNA mismatch repair protein MutS, partial [Acidobacteriota bacterium]